MSWILCRCLVLSYYPLKTYINYKLISCQRTVMHTYIHAYNHVLVCVYVEFLNFRILCSNCQILKQSFCQHIRNQEWWLNDTYRAYYYQYKHHYGISPMNPQHAICSSTSYIIQPFIAFLVLHHQENAATLLRFLRTKDYSSESTTKNTVGCKIISTKSTKKCSNKKYLYIGLSTIKPVVQGWLYRLRWSKYKY